METVAAYLLALVVCNWQKRMAHSSFNTDINTYKTSRKILLAFFFCPIFFMLYDDFDFWGNAIKETGKALTGTPEFIVFATLYTSSILILDANFRVSRNKKFERNILKHIVLGWFFVLPFVICAYICKIPVLLVVYGAIFGKKKLV